MRPSLNPPAIIQPAATLWDWAKTEADAIEATRARLDEKRADLATITAVVEESIEYGELEEAKERLKAAKTAALDCDAVERASDLLAKARKALKAVASAGKAKAIAVCEGLRAKRDMLVQLGVKPENILVADRIGVIYTGRKEEMDPDKQRYARDTKARTLAEIIRGADIFLGLSAAGVLSGDMVKTMADKPIILALANPEPEIRPELAKEARPDCIIATGRSDYPNQVNNVLCFPYIFRGALDCGATRITEEMKVACVHEIAALAKVEMASGRTALPSASAPTTSKSFSDPASSGPPRSDLERSRRPCWS